MGRPTFDDLDTSLFAALSVKNSGTYPINAPLIVVIRNLSDPSVFVANADGTTPDGAPFFDFTKLIAGQTLQPGTVSLTRALMFLDPHHGRFTYDLELLGQLNRPPVFVSQPNLEAIPGVAYIYQPSVTDADHDRLAFSLLTGPAGMAIEPVSGLVSWSPQQDDLGNWSVLLQGRRRPGRQSATAIHRFDHRGAAQPAARVHFHACGGWQHKHSVWPYNRATASRFDDGMIRLNILQLFFRSPTADDQPGASVGVADLVADIE